MNNYRYKNGIYISAIDGKDLWLAMNCINPQNRGYRLRRPNGEYNLRRFSNKLDFSLDMIKMEEVYKDYYEKGHRKKDAPFSFKAGKFDYTTQVVSLTFKYSVKEFNRISSNIYIRNGYCVKDLIFNDCIAVNEDGELVGIQTDTDVKEQYSKLPSYFLFVKGINDRYGHYEATGGIPTVLTRGQVREWLYVNGFDIDGIHYVRYKRSSGSARIGHCNFINSKLYPYMLEYDKMGLDIKNGDKIDLAGFEAYIALTASSIIDTLEIKPENILLIDDYDSKFTDTVMATREINGKLSTKPETLEISNKIWDGQSLIDKSLLGEYDKYGMVLLRNRFYKSCCFNCNMQQWFVDNGITDVSQLKGKTRATSIDQVKLITTPSSIKYLKFGSFDDWLDRLTTTFGIVKHEKKTHYLGGRLVQLHYQGINSTGLTYEETKEFLKPSLEYFTAIRNDPAMMRCALQFGPYGDAAMVGLNDKNDINYKLLNINDKYAKTKMYADFAKTLNKSQYNNIKKGHVLVDGNYSTMVGNPIEMLQASIGTFNGKSQLGVGHIHCSRFPYGITVFGSRSPHVTMGNILLTENVADELIDKYFNFTNEICVINSINENILSRLSGSDFDSDTVLLTNNKTLIEAAKRSYDQFLVPTGLVGSSKINRYFTQEQKADLDIKTSVNKIGEIINFSQVLNSMLWDRLHKGQTVEQNIDLYADIAMLDVMSNLEIDKAKKIFDVDNGAELATLKAKYNIKDDEGKDINPKFFEHIARMKGYYIPGKKNYKLHDASMDYLSTICDKFKHKVSRKNNFGKLSISDILDRKPYKQRAINYEQIKKTLEIVTNFREEEQWIKASKSYDRNEKTLLLDRTKYSMIYDLSKIKYNYSTAYRLMQMIDYSPEVKPIRSTLFYTLLSIPTNDFYRLFDANHEDIVMCEEVETKEESDCEYYGLYYGHYILTKDGEKKPFYSKNEEKTWELPDFDEIFKEI